jgi:hypothetical protein
VAFQGQLGLRGVDDRFDALADRGEVAVTAGLVAPVGV